MKQFKFILTVMVSVLICTIFSSCSNEDEDEPGKGGNGFTATLDGSSLGFNHVYYYTIGNEMIIEFYNYDITNPKFSSNFKVNFLSIDYVIPESQSEIETVTISNGDYHLYLASGVTMSDEGWQGENDRKDPDDSALVIIRDGDDISISIQNATVEDEDAHESKQLKLSYKGKIPLMPEEYRD